MKPAVALAVVIAFLVGVVVGQFAPLSDWFGFEEPDPDAQPSIVEAAHNLVSLLGESTPTPNGVPVRVEGDRVDPGQLTPTPTESPEETEPAATADQDAIESRVWQVGRVIDGTTFELVRGERVLHVVLSGVPTRYSSLDALGPDVRRIWEQLPNRYVHLELTAGSAPTADGQVLALVYLLPNYTPGSDLHHQWLLNDLVRLAR